MLEMPSVDVCVLHDKNLETEPISPCIYGHRNTFKREALGVGILLVDQEVSFIFTSLLNSIKVAHSALSIVSYTLDRR